MTNEQSDVQRAENIRSHLLTLQEHVNELPKKKQVAILAALNAFGTSIEELQVAEEELRQQNDQLYETQQQLMAERQRYLDLFEFAPDGYLVTDSMGRIREANRAAINLFDLDVNLLIGKYITQFVEVHSRSSFLSALGQLSHNGAVHEWRVKMRTHKGRSFDADVRVAPIVETHGAPAHGTTDELRWLVRDVTEHTLADERVRSSEKELTEAQQIAHLGSWHWDIVNNIVSWSDEMYRIYGPLAAGQRLTYDDFLERVYPEDRERVRRVIGDALNNRTRFSFYHRIVRPDGTMRTLHARGRVIVDAQGNPVQMVGTGQDVTEARAAEDEIRRLNEQLEQRVVERTAQLEAAINELKREIADRKQAEHALAENETQFRQLAESIDQVFWLEDATSRRPLYVSPAYEKLFGLPRETMYADPRSFFGVIHPEDRERVMQMFSQRPSGRFSEEYRIMRPNGALRWVWTSTFPVWNSQGQAERFVGLSQDITESKQAENALRTALVRTQELYQISRLIASVRTPADVLHALILSNYLRRINRAAILLFDQPWQDRAPANILALASWRATADLVSIEGQTFPFAMYGFGDLLLADQPVHVEDTETDSRLNQNMRALFARIKTRSVTLFPLIASGQWYGMLSLHSADPGSLGEEDIRHMRGLADQVAVAIYNIRLLEAEAQARREAEIANDLKLKFLAMISHELRTPLTSIKGFATTLLATDVTWDEASQHEFILTINQESDKLTDMIEQLLDLSRLQAGNLRIKQEALAVEDILSTAMAQLRTMTQHHQLMTDVPDNLPFINADRQRIAQVLANLVSNAVKYSPQNTTITLSATADDANVEIDVQDQGIGIPLNERQLIFEAFRRGEGESTNRTKGAGLGLAICKHLIEAHGGRIWIKDAEREGPGTIVAFTVPIAGSNQNGRHPIATTK